MTNASTGRRPWTNAGGVLALSGTVAARGARHRWHFDPAVLNARPA